MSEVNAHKIFIQLRERDKKASPYISHNKDDLIDEILKLEDKNEELHSIIKEVREYIKDACYLDEINYPNSLGHKQTMKVLEILDKENI